MHYNFFDTRQLRADQIELLGWPPLPLLLDFPPHAEFHNLLFQSKLKILQAKCALVSETICLELIQKPQHGCLQWPHQYTLFELCGLPMYASLASSLSQSTYILVHTNVNALKEFHAGGGGLTQNKTVDKYAQALHDTEKTQTHQTFSPVSKLMASFVGARELGNVSHSWCLPCDTRHPGVLKLGNIQALCSLAKKGHLKCWFYFFAVRTGLHLWEKRRAPGTYMINILSSIFCVMAMGTLETQFQFSKTCHETYMSPSSVHIIPVHVSRSFPSWSSTTAIGFGHSSVVIPLRLQSNAITSPKLVSFACW